MCHCAFSMDTISNLNILINNKTYQNKHIILTNLLFLDPMWNVKDDEVGRSTPDAELLRMLCQRHVEFHDVGPTTGQYQSPNKRFSFSTISFPEILVI
jgi:hypothetical protein